MHRSIYPLRVLLLYIALLLTGAASAQALEVGVVLSLSGTDAGTGAEQLAALELSARALERRGLRLELHLLDDRSHPETAAAHALGLSDRGVYALVCCTTPRTADAVQAAAPPLPTLSLSHPTRAYIPLAVGVASRNDWFVSLEPSGAQRLARVAQEATATAERVALLAPESEAGDTASAVLGARLGEGFVGEARYPPRGEEALTPEALWVITREPSAVVVWGERAGDAVQALSERGYTGALYLEAHTLRGFGVLQRARLSGAGERVRAVLSPFELGFALSETHPSAAEGSRYRRAAALSGARGSLAGAHAWDAALLLGAALEQALAYGFPEVASEVQTLRQGLRDTLLGLEPLAGSSGVLRLQAANSSAVDAASLVVVQGHQVQGHQVQRERDSAARPRATP